jgi:hypothetical protein
MKTIAATFPVKKLAPFIALAVIAAGAVTLAGNANAQSRKGQAIIVADAPVYVGVAPRVYMSKHRHVARHGVYYAPRVLVPAPSVGDDFADDDYPESEEDDFERADIDSDGFISMREARRTQPEWARDFRRIDTSGDGYLTREEVDAFYRPTDVKR